MTKQQKTIILVIVLVLIGAFFIIAVLSRGTTINPQGSNTFPQAGDRASNPPPSLAQNNPSIPPAPIVPTPTVQPPAPVSLSTPPTPPTAPGTSGHGSNTGSPSVTPPSSSGGSGGTPPAPPVTPVIPVPPPTPPVQPVSPSNNSITPSVTLPTPPAPSPSQIIHTITPPTTPSLTFNGALTPAVPQTIVTWYTYGGSLCTAPPCAPSTLTIMNDGTYSRDGQVVAHLSTTELQTLNSALAATNFTSLLARTAPQSSQAYGCSGTFVRTRYVFVLRNANNNYQIDACAHEVEGTESPFTILEQLHVIYH